MISKTAQIPLPLPLFDSIEYIADEKNFSYLDSNLYDLNDINMGIAFLKPYRGSQGTFNSYRREIERFIHWTALIEQKALKALKRDTIESYMEFCQKPPKQWIGTTKPPRFIEKNGLRTPNTAWRPFVATISKNARRKGDEPEINQFEFTQGSMKESFAILGSFFNFLLQEEYVQMNPVTLIRQKSKFIRRTQSQPKIRRLSELQWQYVIQTIKKHADETIMDKQGKHVDLKLKDKYERMLFILSALYSMYLRISELCASARWVPEMSDFFRDSDNNWWFTTVGKGNKERQIAVSETMLDALKRWRKHLNLYPLPSLTDNSPLIPKTRGTGPIKSINYIRRVVQDCFDQGIQQLSQDGFEEEAEMLNEATVHWLRHTGISDDVKIRPREHVRDDAGHSSSAITDKYIDIELRERHRSARKKIIMDD